MRGPGIEIRPAPRLRVYGRDVTGSVLYDDGHTLLDGDGVTLRHYYFPTGASKSIPYARIVVARSRRMGWMSGKGRLWGTASPTRWLPLDGGRSSKDVLVCLDLGGRVQPAFSPDDPEALLRLLAERVRVERDDAPPA